MAKKRITYAEVADKLSKKIGQLEKDLKSSDRQAQETAKRMMPRYQEKMDRLYSNQEEMKALKLQRDRTGRQLPNRELRLKRSG